MSKIEASCVMVVGLGGVGSHAAHMIARSGVGRLILVDFDQVTLSSTNRHATAQLKDVGIPKVEAVRQYLAGVCPNCEVLTFNEMFTAESASKFLDDQGKLDFVVDAIDDIPTKAHLVAGCVNRGIRFISSMGAACKADPTRIHIGDLRSATKDPLCTKLRWQLRKLDIDIDHPLMTIIYSSEKVTSQLAPLTAEQAAAPKEFGAVDNMRLRVLPVIGTMPAIIGQSCASYVMCELGGKPFSPIAAERMSKQVRHRMLQHVKNREGEVRKAIEKGDAPEGAVASCLIDIDDVEFLMSQLWKNRCLISGERLGNTLELIKWDVKQPASVNNLVLMSAKGLKKFKEVGREGLDRSIVDAIERRLQSVDI